MANKKIKGITIRFDAETSGLDKALKDVESTSKDLNWELKQVNNLLKFDPKNTQMLAQKQKVLTDSIDNTKKKLDALKQAQSEVERMFKTGEIGAKEYREFQRTVAETEQSLRTYESQLKRMDEEQERMRRGVKELDTLLEATGKSLDDFQDVIGSKLTNALKDGTAGSDDLTVAINKIGKAALGADTDLGKMRDALNKIDDGGIKAVKEELEGLKGASAGAEEELNGLGKGIASGNLMEAADVIADLGEKVMDLGGKAVETFQNIEGAAIKVNARLGDTGEEAERNADLIKKVYESGLGDSMDSVANAVLLVKDNLKELNDADLEKIISNGLILEDTYGVDMTESLRGVNALMEYFGLSAADAMDYLIAGTQNGLDKTNELGDNLSEYSGKFAEAGYSTQEYFQLLQNGLDNGAYNLDKVNDAINEVTTRIADGTIAESLSQINEKTGKLEESSVGWGSNVEDVFKQWQQGGATQKQVIDAIVADIQGTENQQDKLNKAALAFGTMAEDGSMKFISSLTSVGETYTDVTGKSDEFQEKTTTSAQEMEAAIRRVEDAAAPIGEDIQKALLPVLEFIADLAEKFAELPEPVRNFIEVLGGIAAAVAVITPIITAIMAISGALSFLNLSLLPIVGIVAGVSAVIMGVILAVRNWGEITEWVAEKWKSFMEWLTEKWESFTEWLGGMWESIGDSAADAWDGIKNYFEELWESILSKASETWNEVKDYFEGIWTSIASEAAEIWDGITECVVNTWNNIKNFFETVWAGIYSVIEVPLNLIKALIEGAMYAIYAIMYTAVEVIKAIWEWIGKTASEILEPIVDFIVGIWKKVAEKTVFVWEECKKILSDAWGWISKTAVDVFGSITDFFMGIWIGMTDTAIEAWETIKEGLSSAWEWIKTTAASIFTPIADYFKETWSNIKSTILDTWEAIKKYLSDTWNKIKEEGIRIFSGLWDNIKNGFKSLKDDLGKIVKDIANKIIKPFGNAINGVIKGVNWILDKVGSKKRFDLWEIPQFARGAAGLPEDTIGVVNDQKGPVYKELIVPPKGKPFVPEGRDVVLPMKKGTRILPAKETRNFLDGLPHFANGIGSFFSGAWETIKNFTGNIWDYISHPGKIVQIAIDKFTDLSGIVEPWLSVTKGAVNTVFDSVVDFIKGIFDTETAVNYNPSAGVEQWRGLAERALRMAGQYSEANLTRLLYQMQTESGGNPKAINNWDINAKRGTPSKGLMQVIDPTFRAYAMPGYNTNIYDPLSNMLASIRYAVARYGSLAKAYRGVGYEGGIGKINLSDLLAMPKLDISWFKDGGILTKPAAFQMANGKWGGAGESGDEVIAPTDKLKKYVQEAVLEIFGTKNIEINMNITQTIDGRVLAAQSGRYIQPVLDDMEGLKKMLRGER